jgi:hypothetical protein
VLKISCWWLQACLYGLQVHALLPVCSSLPLLMCSCPQGARCALLSLALPACVVFPAFDVPLQVLLGRWSCRARPSLMMCVGAWSSGLCVELALCAALLVTRLSRVVPRLGATGGAY